MVDIIQRRLTGSVRLNISHVADVPFGRVRTGVRFVGWIKMSACGSRIRGAAIAEFMNMKAMVSGSETCYLGMDLHAIGIFCEGNRAAHFVTCRGMKHRNGF